MFPNNQKLLIKENRLADQRNTPAIFRTEHSISFLCACRWPVRHFATVIPLDSSFCFEKLMLCFTPFSFFFSLCLLLELRNKMQFGGQTNTVKMSVLAQVLIFFFFCHFLIILGLTGHYPYPCFRHDRGSLANILMQWRSNLKNMYEAQVVSLNN